jgi:hypothetical protein
MTDAPNMDFKRQDMAGVARRPVGQDSAGGNSLSVSNIGALQNDQA